jgi:hypothetical protein
VFLRRFPHRSHRRRRISDRYGASLSCRTAPKVVAALLAFFGVVITAAAKHFVDMRSEQRLRLDAAMEAGKLLSSTDGTVSSPAAAASGLLALADLGRSKLAVAMLLDL